MLRPEGTLVIDPGACNALMNRGRSLLPSGVITVIGNFDIGAPVQCQDENGEIIASGLSNYSSSDIERIKGLKTSHIQQVLGYKDNDEIIHRDNLVLKQPS